MKHLFALGLLTATLCACGVNGAPVREGPKPPVVATSVIESGTTDPDKPRGTLF